MSDGLSKPKDLRMNPFAESGSTGLIRFGGDIREEFVRNLEGHQRANKIYKEMSRNDATIGSMLFAINKLISQVPWEVEPFSSQPEDIAAAEFLETCMNDMEHSWSEFIQEILSFVVFGWSYHEIVYKVRRGEVVNKETMVLDEGLSSKFDDGRIGWKKIPLRSQETLWDWKYCPDSQNLLGMIQQGPPDYKTRFIPLWKALHFRTTSHKDNPEGLSVLRNAYRPWFIKKHIENFESIGVERDLAGIPVAWVPANLLDGNATAAEKAALNEFKKIVSNIKLDEQSGIVMPMAFDENNNKLYDITLLTTGGSRQFDTSAIIDRWDRRILMTVLADFIMLGQTGVGSFALSSDKTQLFSTALGSWLDLIAGEFNRKAIRDLFRMNNRPTDRLPILTHGDIESVDLAALGTFISAMTGAGAQLFPDDKLENHLKRQAGLPVEQTADEELSLDGSTALELEGDDGGDELSRPTPDQIDDPVSAEGPESEPIAKAKSPKGSIDREKLLKARDDRSNKYGISITRKSSLSFPDGLPADLRLFGDPVNLKFPMADAAQANNARRRFKQFARTIYPNDVRSQRKVHTRIVKRQLSLGQKPDFSQDDSLDRLLPGDLKRRLMAKRGQK